MSMLSVRTVFGSLFLAIAFVFVHAGDVCGSAPDPYLSCEEPKCLVTGLWLMKDDVPVGDNLYCVLLDTSIREGKRIFHGRRYDQNRAYIGYGRSVVKGAPGKEVTGTYWACEGTPHCANLIAKNIFPTMTRPWSGWEPVVTEEEPYTKRTWKSTPQRRIK